MVRTEPEKLELLKSMGNMSLQEKWDMMLDISAQEDVPTIDQIEQVIELIGHTPKGVKKVLVVGCGDGTEIKEFNDRGYEAVGIQVNKKQNKEIRAKGLDARDMDMHFMDFKNDEFDMVFCKDCFKQAISPTFAFAEFCRVAKYILISEPDMSWAWKAHNYQLFNTEQFKILGDKFGYPLEESWVIPKPYVQQQCYLFKRK
jgi:SAM-dependent methyltransferase